MTSPLLFALGLAGSSPQMATPVTVEIVAVGHAESPATSFMLDVTLSASGDTEIQAKAILAKNKAILLDKLKSSGVTLVPARSGMSKPKRDLSKIDFFSADADDKSKEANGKASVEERFSIESHNRASITKAQELIAGTADATADQPPVTSLGDANMAIRAAKRDALNKAKADAQNYADALGYSDAILLTVSERADLGTMYAAALSIATTAKDGRPTMFEPSHGDTVPTDVAVVVTFRLEGKR